MFLVTMVSFYMKKKTDYLWSTYSNDEKIKQLLDSGWNKFILK